MSYEDPYEEIEDLEELEVEEEPKPLWQRILWRSFKVVVGLAVVVGLIYLSGFRQFFFYRKTPDVQVERMESVLQAEEIKVPISAKIIRASESNKESNRNEEGILQLVDQANQIWAQADITLEMKSVELISMRKERLEDFLESPSNLESFDKDSINAFFIGNLEGPSGLAYSSTVLVADYTTAHDYLVFAHEVGHVLGLSHVDPPNRLMSSGADGPQLTKEEIKKARKRARELLK